MIRHVIPIHVKLVFPRSGDDSLARNLDAENKNTEDDEYNDHLSMKKHKIYFQSHDKTRKILLF